MAYETWLSLDSGRNDPDSTALLNNVEYAEDTRPLVVFVCSLFKDYQQAKDGMILAATHIDAYSNYMLTHYLERRSDPVLEFMRQNIGNRIFVNGIYFAS